MTPTQARALLIRSGTPHESGHLTQGNIDLSQRPMVYNNDGSYSTTRSGSYENNAGQEVLVPTVANDGSIMPMRAAMTYWGKKGQDLGRFASPDQADAFAIWLHNQQAKAGSSLATKINPLIPRYRGEK